MKPRDRPGSSNAKRQKRQGRASFKSSSSRKSLRGRAGKRVAVERSSQQEAGDESADESASRSNLDDDDEEEEEEEAEGEGKTSKPLFFDYHHQQQLDKENDRFELEQQAKEVAGRGFRGSKLNLTVDTLYISAVSDTNKLQRTCFVEGEEEALDEAAAAADEHQDQTQALQRKRERKEYV